MMMVSCELYYDDVTVTSFINVKYGDVAAESIQNMKHLLFIFCGQKNLSQMLFSPVYCFVLRYQPWMFGVRSLLMIEKVSLMSNDRDDLLFRRPTVADGYPIQSDWRVLIVG